MGGVSGQPGGSPLQLDEVSDDVQESGLRESGLRESPTILQRDGEQQTAHAVGFQRITPELLRDVTSKVSCSVTNALHEPFHARLRTVSRGFSGWFLQAALLTPSPCVAHTGLDLQMKRKELLSNLKPVDDGPRPLLVVQRGHVLDSLFAVAAFDSNALLSQPYIHFLGEEGTDAGGLLHDWADAVAKALNGGEECRASCLVVAGCGDERLNGEYMIAGMVDNKPKYLKLQDGSCVVHYYAQRSVWRMAVLGAAAQGSTIAMYESAELDETGCGSLCGRWDFALHVEEPAPIVEPKGAECTFFEVTGAGEASVNGTYCYTGHVGVKPVYKHTSFPSCTVFWEQRSQEWRLYCRNYKNDITLYKNASHSDTMPCTGWQVATKKAIEPLPTVSLLEVPPLFTEGPDGTLIPKPKDKQLPPSDPVWRLYFGVGRFIGLGLSLGLPLPLALNRVTLRLFLGQEVLPEDIARIDLQFYKTRLCAVLQPDGVQELEKVLCEPLTFVSAPTERQPEPKELVPNGAARRVDESNKHEYVRLLCEDYLCGGVRTEIALIHLGFSEIVEPGVLDALDFTCADLSLLLCGLPSYDVDDWESHTAYSEPGAAKEEMKAWFFAALRGGNDAMRGRVLHFVTGSSRVPAGGFAQLRPPFRLHIYTADGPQLPSAHACSNTLDLPRYQDAAELSENLLLALENSGGFGFR